MRLEMKCKNMQNNAETIFYFYPELELVTLASASAFKITVQKLLNAYRKTQEKKFSVFDEFDNEYRFEILG